MICCAADTHRELSDYIYPRLYGLHDMSPNVCLPVCLSACLPASLTIALSHYRSLFLLLSHDHALSLNRLAHFPLSRINLFGDVVVFTAQIGIRDEANRLPMPSLLHLSAERINHTGLPTTRHTHVVLSCLLFFAPLPVDGAASHTQACTCCAHRRTSISGWPATSPPTLWPRYLAPRMPSPTARLAASFRCVLPGYFLVAPLYPSAAA